MARAMAQALVVLLLAVVMTPAAHAYLDPGTGSIILQGLIAGFAAAALVARQFWHRITSFLRDPFNRKRDREQDATAPDDQS